MISHLTELLLLLARQMMIDKREGQWGWHGCQSGLVEIIINERDEKGWLMWLVWVPSKPMFFSDLQWLYSCQWMLLLILIWDIQHEKDLCLLLNTHLYKVRKQFDYAHILSTLLHFLIILLKKRKTRKSIGTCGFERALETKSLAFSSSTLFDYDRFFAWHFNKYHSSWSMTQAACSIHKWW